MVLNILVEWYEPRPSIEGHSSLPTDLGSESGKSNPRRFQEARQQIIEETVDWRWSHISSHDRRRSLVIYHLVGRPVDVRMMMAIGGQILADQAVS